MIAGELLTLHFSFFICNWRLILPTSYLYGDRHRGSTCKRCSVASSYHQMASLGLPILILFLWTLGTPGINICLEERERKCDDHLAVNESTHGLPGRPWKGVCVLLSAAHCKGCAGLGGAGPGWRWPQVSPGSAAKSLRRDPMETRMGAPGGVAILF